MDACTYSLQELCKTLVDNSFDNASVDIRKPDRHHGSNDEQQTQDHDVAHFFAVPARNHMFDQFANSLPEKRVNVSLSAVLNKQK